VVTLSELQDLLQGVCAGDARARDHLLEHLSDRLLALARKMLHQFPAVHRWDRTSDVYQGAMVRLVRALDQVKPDTIEGLVRLASQQIRRELLDLARRYSGPTNPGVGRGTRTDPFQEESSVPIGAHDEPDNVAVWTEFHRQVERLPDKEREIFDLVWYQELTQTEAAQLLQITERTVRNRWVSARLLLANALEGGNLPG
jgi:RNA polymerase sigma-70 factor (ECF subfamily)